MRLRSSRMGNGSGGATGFLHVTVVVLCFCGMLQCGEFSVQLLQKYENPNSEFRKRLLEVLVMGIDYKRKLSPAWRRNRPRNGCMAPVLFGSSLIAVSGAIRPVS